MRTVELAKVAVAAETIRLRRIVHRQSMRVAYAAAAAVFAMALFAVLHVLIYLILRVWLPPVLSALIVLAFDAVAAAIFGSIALRNTPDAAQWEAEQIKAQAVAEIKRSLTVMAVAAEVTGLVLRRRARTGVPRGAASVVAELVSRLVGR